MSGDVRVLTGGSSGREVAKKDRSRVVVYLTGFSQPAPPEPAKLRQKNRTFIPDVLPIVVGQKVDFVNDDSTLHNVFSRSVARSFDLGKARSKEVLTERFTKTGVIDLYCDIHEKMVANILVLPNRAFAVTGPDGRFTLTGVPPGRYTAFAWHRRGRPAQAEVVVPDGGNAKLQLTLKETELGELEAPFSKYGTPHRKQGSRY